MGYFTNYPKHVFLILSNEFCERFSYYGMKAILVIYLTDALRYSEESAVSIYHAFNMLCYFTPVLGAMIADGWLGKYKTIAYISILYFIGNVVMAVTAIPMNDGEWIRWPPFIALTIIAFGTGGIKPCVSSFGGDQFSADQQKQKDSFFSLFYMSINIGSLLSTFITPLIRANVKCYGQECYAVAFGIPAVLMAVAVVLFFIGTPWYTRNPPGESILVKMFGCIGTALKGKCSCSNPKDESKESWLDYASPKYEDQFIQEVKDVLRVCWLFIPLPVFWALFDQQSSLWIFQARSLNGDFGGGFVVEPDMMPIFNPLLVVIMVPILESVIYPCFDKLHIPNRPLQRMSVGMIMAAIAFIMAGFLQLAIDNESPSSPAANQIRISFINIDANCKANLSRYGEHIPETTIEPFDHSEYYYANKVDEQQIRVTMDCTDNVPSSLDLDFPKDDQSTYQAFLNASHSNIIWQPNLDFASGQRSTLRVYNMLPFDVNFTVIQGTEDKPKLETVRANSHSVSENTEILLEDFTVNVTRLDGNGDTTTRVEYTGHSENGASYTIILNGTDMDTLSIVQLTDLEPRGINIFLQVPQYFVITLGETLFSVTGLGFAYTQAAPSMKSILTACWLLTVAFGNVLVIVVELAGQAMSKMAMSFFFAGLMLVTTVIFSIMSMFYKYVDSSVAPLNTEPTSLSDGDGGKQNLAYDNEDEEKKIPDDIATYDNIDESDKLSDNIQNIAL